MKEFDHLPELPGTPQEQAWLRERLETLSVRESYALTAALEHCPPETTREAVRCLQSLDEYEVVFPGYNYDQLGEYYLLNGIKVPEEVVAHTDLYEMGRQYEDGHPGIFVGGCYVAYPDAGVPRQEGALPLEDTGWSVKVKLASPAAPDGVWIRLPCRAGTAPLDSVEILLALDELNVESLEDCTLLDARCILPEAGCLMEQYSNITNLVNEGTILGHIMNNRGGEEPYWMAAFHAALEYEDCHTLRLALDIAQNPRCFTWVPREELADYAARRLSDCGVPDEIIHSGAIDLESYAGELLETSGYMQAGGETGYLLRSNVSLIQDYSLREEEPRQQDIMKDFPWLERLSRRAGREEAAAAKETISEALAGRGDEGLRQLQAAMDLEKCASLKQAAEIAARLDSYEFVEPDSFRETAEQELLNMGLDKEVIARCINLDAYAALTQNFEVSHCYGSAASVYIRKKDGSPQPGQGMVMQ